MASDNPLAFFQSPQWLEHQRGALGDTLGLLSVRGESEDTVGMAPLMRKPHVMKFNVKKRVFGKTTLRALEIPGGAPLLPADASLHDAVLEALFGVQPACDCLVFERVSKESFFWGYVHRSPAVARRCLVYVPQDTIDRSHSIVLPETFEQYLAHFPPKFRRELGRQVRRLRDHGQGVLDLRRYESPQESGEFLAAAARVAGQSWQHAQGNDVVEDNDHWRGKLASLAEQGVLRAYLLWCGDAPCAVELGYQLGGVFHGIMTYYDPALADFSPGSVLLYLFIEDLVRHKPPKRLDFGSGDYGYKRRFGNNATEEATILLLRKTALNRLRRSCHSAFRSCVSFAKARLQRSTNK